MKSFHEYYLEVSGQDTKVDWSGLELLKKYAQDFKKNQKAYNSLTPKEKQIFDNADVLIANLEQDKKKLDKEFAKVEPTKANATLYANKMKKLSNRLTKIQTIKEKFKKNFK